MNRKKTVCALVMALLMVLANLSGLSAYAEADAEVAAVIAQLNNIDSLEEMQAARSNFNVSGSYSEATASEHEAAQAGYEEYLAKMFSARMAAQQAYNALSDSQKAQIESSLAAKLTDTLDTSWKPAGATITTGTDGYIYQVVFPKPYRAYEISQYLSTEMPQTLIMVDSSRYAGAWEPNGKYSYGESNYDVLYCCDAVWPVKNGTHYRRVNLENSDYYGPEAAKKIRAIVQNSYPYISISEMKERLIDIGMDPELVSELKRGDLIAGIQFAIWTFANNDILETTFYAGTINTSIYKNGPAYHDFSTESWEWWSAVNDSKNNLIITYDPEAEYRVNTLTRYLCGLEGVESTQDQIVISDIEVLRSEPISLSDGTSNVSVKVILNHGAGSEDSVNINIVSTAADGTVTHSSTVAVGSDTAYNASFVARSGDTVKVTVEGTQHLDKGVYFYEPQGGRTKSQVLVGMAEGETPVYAEQEFVFTDEMETGIRIYKSDRTTQKPISDITFHVYKVNPGEGDTLSEKPTPEEIALYADDANKAGSVVTDEQGYAELELEKGIYMVVEAASDKVSQPVDPFYVVIPMKDSETDEDLNIVSVYPKNEPTTPPEPPTVTPPPPSYDEEDGGFTIVKHNAADESIVLEGAEFEVYRLAADGDANAITLNCGGVDYSAVQVTRNGSALTLTTGYDGTASVSGLEYGVYLVVETKAPAGYDLAEEPVMVTVSAVDSELTVKVPNIPGIVLPDTGSTGVSALYAAALMLLTLAAAVLAGRRRAH